MVASSSAPKSGSGRAKSPFDTSRDPPFGGWSSLQSCTFISVRGAGPSGNIVYRFAFRNNDRLPVFASELVRRRVDCHHHAKQPPDDVRRKRGGHDSTPSRTTRHATRRRAAATTHVTETRIPSYSVADAHCQRMPSETARAASAGTTTTQVPMLWRRSC